MAKKVKRAAKRKVDLKPHQLTEAQKKRFTLRGRHPQTRKNIVCKYDPATKQWDNCSQVED